MTRSSGRQIAMRLGLSPDSSPLLEEPSDGVFLLVKQTNLILILWILDIVQRINRNRRFGHYNQSRRALTFAQTIAESATDVPGQTVFAFYGKTNLRYECGIAHPAGEHSLANDEP